MRALFLDRDGVINIDYGYVYDKQNFVFVDGIFDLCRTGISNDYKIIIITNQSGIARGYFSEEDFLKLNSWMLKIFKEKGIKISQTYYCPFHPVHGLGRYKRDDHCRKPSPGMILKAEEEHKLNLKESVLIGDKATDVQAGKRAGVKYNLLFTQDDPFVHKDTLIIKSLDEAYVYFSC